MPAASPSRPSIRLIAWPIPRSHNTVIQRLEVVGQDDLPVVERQAEREHDDAEPHEREAGEPPCR